MGSQFLRTDTKHYLLASVIEKGIFGTTLAEIGI